MSTTIKLAHDVTLTSAEGGGVLFSKRTGDFFGLNETATELLRELLVSNLDVAAMTIAGRYGVSPDETHADLQKFVEDLHAAKLVEFQDRS